MITRLTRHLRSLAVAAALAFATIGAFDGVAQPAATAAAERAAPREILNSERIAQRFGSYGIAVLESDGLVRVSNLYSEGSDGRTCRTFAVVAYPSEVDPALAAEHAEIVRGGSIGAVFASHGWKVGKSNLEFFTVEATTRLADLLHVNVGTPLAAHAYVFDVSKGGAPLEYALIAEIHHPDYQTLESLGSIYGGANASGRESSLASLRATVREKVGR